MKEKIRKGIEPNRKIAMLEITVTGLLMVSLLFSCFLGFRELLSSPGETVYKGQLEMVRDRESEDYDEDYTVCAVTYTNGDKTMVVNYSYEEYEELESDTITAYEYVTETGESLFFDHQQVNEKEIVKAYKEVMAEETKPVFNLAISLGILLLSIQVMFFFGAYFSLYEKIWFLSIMVLATIFAVLFPEEDANGINGIVIMLLYLLDTFLNILCELLISKQSRYNFLVSIGVEITEIAICLILMYRFATMAVTLFFWLPIDIISYINWSKHLDKEEEELTVVRKLKGYQEVLIILAIVVWTVGVGYLLSGLDIKTDFYNDAALEKTIIYIDACASAVGVANGLFIFFRLREQWIAWYICAALEAVINVLSGQYVLLILKLGYFTNTTYGYIKWSRYIKGHAEAQPSLF